MANLPIVCLSRKRADKLTTKIDNMVLLVDELELDDYSELGYEVHTHPSLRNLSQIRQFAYTKFGDLFMVDDDIMEFLDLQSGKSLNAQRSYELIEDTYYRAIELGCYQFGFNNSPQPTHFTKQKPFMLYGYMNGCGMGLRASPKLYFNDEIVGAEDFWILCLNYYHYRKVFIDKRFCVKQIPYTTFTVAGGQSGRRTTDSCKIDFNILKEYFGNAIIEKKTQNKQRGLYPFQPQLNVRWD